MEELNEVKKSIIRNNFFLFLGDIISKIFEFAFIIIIVRYLSIRGFGIYSYWLSLSSIIVFVIDFGAGNLIIRELAIDPEKTNSYFSNILLIKILFSLIFISISFVLMFILIDDLIFLYAGYIMIISLITKTFNQQLFYSIFRSHERMGYQALVTIINSSSKLFFIFLLLYNNNFNVVHVTFFDLSSNIITLVLCIFILNKYFFHPKIEIDKPFWIEIFKRSIYFGLIPLIIHGVNWIEITILLLYKGEDAVAIYNAAFKLIQPLLLITVVVISAIFPILSRYYKKSLKIFRLIFLRYLKYLVLLSFPLSIIISIYSEEIIRILYGLEYIGSSIPLQLLAWYPILIIVYSHFKKYFESSNKQKFLVIAAFLSMIFDIVLNLFLVPILGYVGTSLSKLISLIPFVIALCVKSKQDIDYNLKSSFNWIGKIGLVFTGLVVSLVITKHYFVHNLNLFSIAISLSISLTFYFFLILLLKIIDFKELKMLLNTYKFNKYQKSKK